MFLVRNILIALALLAAPLAAGAQTVPPFVQGSQLTSAQMNVLATAVNNSLKIGNSLSEIAAAGTQAPALVNLVTVAHVQTTAALEALPVSLMAAGTIVVKDGYYTSGDMPSAPYVYSTSACSLNSGAGDGGSQIPSIGGGCFDIASLPSYDPRQWGASPSTTVDASSYLTPYFAFLATVPTSGTQAIANFGGQSYATSIPLNPKRVTIENGSLWGLTNAGWASTTGLLYIPSGVSNVTVRDFYLDGQLVANIQLMFIGATSNIVLDNVVVEHWGTGGGGVIVNGGKVAIYRLNSQQFVTGDSGYGNPSAMSGVALGFYGAADSSVFGGNLDESLYPLWVDSTSHHIGFSMVHFYNGPGQSGNLLTNPSCGVVNGYAIDFEGTYIDTCQFTVSVPGNSRISPEVVFNGGRALNNIGTGTLTSWINVTTTIANSNLNHFSVSGISWTPNNEDTTGIPIVTISQSGSGSWSDPALAAAISAWCCTNLEIDGPVKAMGSNENMLGQSFLTGNLLADTAYSQNYTALETDTGSQYALNNTGASYGTTLPNSLLTGWEVNIDSLAIGTMTNTFTAASGATLNGVAGGSIVVPQNVWGHMEVGRNNGGSAAQYLMTYQGFQQVSHSPTGAYSFQLSDCGNTVAGSNSTNAETYTVPQITLGSIQACDIDLIIKGSGTVTLVNGSGATLNSSTSFSQPLVSGGNYRLSTTDGTVWGVSGGGLVTAAGQLIGVQTFTSTSCASGCTYTPDAGTTEVIVEQVGAGAGAGGAAATGSGQSAIGMGGGAGSYTEVLLTSGFSGVTVTDPAGGAGGTAGGAGSTGGTATFGSIISCPGGVLGAAGGVHSSVTIGGVTGRASACTNSSGTLLASVPGATSISGLIVSPGTAAQSGGGANDPFGTGGAPISAATQAGNNAIGSGAGGSGGVNENASEATAVNGGNGAGAQTNVYEYGS